MWLHKGLDLTSNSDIQQPSPTWRQGKGGVHPTDAESGGWNSDGTDGAMVGLKPPEAREPEAIGPDRRWRLGRQEMEEDGNEQEQCGDFSK